MLYVRGNSQALHLQIYERRVETVCSTDLLMNRDHLYNVAFRYKKAGLWKKLWDSEVFALRLKSGKTGYICIMGKNGEYCALGLYIGESGFQSYRKIANFGGYTGSPFKDHEALLGQDCLQLALETKEALTEEEITETRAYAKEHGIRLAGKNTYPQFIKYEPNHHPWKVRDDEDIAALCEAAEVAILLADLLKDIRPADLGIESVESETNAVPLFENKGDKLERVGTAPLPMEEGEVYPEVMVASDLLPARLKRLRKKGVWEAELLRMLEAVQNDPEETPYYPLMLLVAESESGYLLHVPMIMDMEKNPQEFFNGFTEAWEMQKVYPKEFRCRDERTYAWLKDLIEKTGTKISIYRKSMPALDEAEAALASQMQGSDDGAEQLMDMVEMLLSLPSSELKKMPREFLDDLSIMIDQGVFPPDLAKELKRKLRGIR